MTSNTSSPRMQRVEVAGRSILLSEGEIAAFEQRFAEVLDSNEQPSEIPTFTGTDAEVSAAAKPPAKARPVRRQLWQNQTLIIGLGGALLTLVIIALSMLAERGQPGSPALPLPLAVVSSPTTVADTATAAPTAERESTVVAYFDYQNVSSSTAITATGILRVTGQADSWRLVALSNGRPSVWIRLADLPAGVPVAAPLPDLAPRPTLPPAPTQQPAAPSGGSSLGSGTPAQCETQADIRFTTDYDVTDKNANGTTNFIGHAHGQSCYSQTEADSNAKAHEAVVRAEAAANPTNTPAPTATDMPMTMPFTLPSVTPVR